MKKIFKYSIIIILILAIAYFIYTFLKPKQKKETNKVLLTIEKYNYTLSKSSTKEYKDLFYKLKDTLEEADLNEKEYAELINKLFIIDFYTLQNKLSNNDIGGLQYIYKDAREKFIIDAKNTIYKYVKNNMYGNRKQDLPYVTEVEIVNVTNEKVTYQNKQDDKAYIIKSKVKYKEQLDYPEEITITLIKEDSILSIIDIK